MLNLKVKGSIILPKDYIPIVVQDEIRRRLSFVNPFDQFDTLYGYRETKDTLYLPKSFASVLSTLVGDLQFTYELVESHSPFTLKEGFSLRPYQQSAEKEILSLLRNQHSVLFTAETGAGKTFSLSSVLSKLNQRTLILAHLTLLTEQMKEEMEANTTAKILVLHAKSTLNDIISADIVISSFALLSKHIELVWKLSENIGTLVVDETENMLSPTRLDIIFRMSPKYSIFISATPSRSLLKRTPLLRYFISDNIVSMPLPDEHKIPVTKVMLKYIDKSWQSPSNSMFYKRSLWRFLRDSGIVNDVVDIARVLREKYKGCIWFIVDLNKAQKYVKDRLLEAGFPEKEIAIINAGTPKKKRRAIIEGIKHGSVKFVIGSEPISAGVSFPNLNVAFRLLPHSSSDELLEQQKGRLKRFAEFKKEYPPMWFDLAISGSLEYGGKKRFRKYKEEPNGITKFVDADTIIKELLCK